MTFCDGSNAGTEDRATAKSDMREIGMEFRKEVDLTIKKHADGLHRQLIEATARVEARFVKNII